MKTSLVLRITILAILMAFAIPFIIGQSETQASPPAPELKLKDVIIQSIPACKQASPAGDREALRVCLKGKILAFLKEQSGKVRKSKAVPQSSVSIQPASTIPFPVEDIQTAKVVRVIDGDTIEIEGGQRLRYIGIDTTETVDPRKPVQCFGKEASAKNKALVEGKEVSLEKDISETDRYGRLLRYVYVGDTQINELLVKEGYATSYSYPPDIKYQDRLRAAEADARANDRGLWNECELTTPTPSPTRTPYPTATPRPKSTPIILPEVEKTPYERPLDDADSSGSDCEGHVTCGSLSSCAEARYYLNVCGQKSLDRDGDGTPCETLCK